MVQAAKFPPQGRRGFGSLLALERFSSNPTLTEYLNQANDALLTIVQVETREAFESVEEIIAVDGIDALFIGPFDLGKFKIFAHHSANRSANTGFHIFVIHEDIASETLFFFSNTYVRQ